MARRNLKRRPAWHGGYVSVWGVYAPGPLVDYQMDASGMISAALYREHLARFDELVLRAFPFSVLHLHASGLHLTDVVAGMEGVRCVEITLERETGKWDPRRVLEACLRLKAAGKPVLLSGELDEREISWFLRGIGEGGTAVFSWPPRGAAPQGR